MFNCLYLYLASFHELRAIVREIMAPFYHVAGGLAMLSGLAAAKYDEYILAPTSRTLYPAKVHGSNGTITGAESLIGSSGGEAVFDGVAAVTYDFVSPSSNAYATSF